MQPVQVWLWAGFVHHPWIIFRWFKRGREAQLVSSLRPKQDQLQGIAITNLIHVIL